MWQRAELRSRDSAELSTDVPRLIDAQAYNQVAKQVQHLLFLRIGIVAGFTHLPSAPRRTR